MWDVTFRGKKSSGVNPKGKGQDYWFRREINSRDLVGGIGGGLGWLEEGSLVALHR